MSLMQLPAPITSAKVIVSFRYATGYCYVSYSAKSRPYSHSLFTIVRRAFQTRKCDDTCLLKLKYALPVNVSKMGIRIAGFSGTFSFQQYYN